ncbi:ketopantoate reductase pane/apba [Trichococcus palustris]|uniref:2-dehydropantoate 2-reductase n=1 Tax=Trichococcus palustris TaxID=140314 RepID=A0A143YPV8_9LACT|nr:ketopantoate reductase family protein [Trichococcus palustris]CZQ93742.1 ketopantoate reductase pane/apba [Trichococcus palustris]SFK83193.1 2-dehydropantoate 2-reductase [Trichococcus palustris]
MKIETVAIVGLGALGILYGHHFTKAIGKDRVRIVVNKERMERYEKEGIVCNGEKCAFQYVDERAEMQPADLVIIAVKGTNLDAAIETARHQIGPDTTILSVLNGIASEEVLANVFGSEKIVHCVAQGMDALRSGNEVNYVHIGELRIGIDKDEPQKQARLDAVTAFFEETALPYVVEDDIMHRMWAKFMLNVGVNQVLMVKEGVFRDIQVEGPSRELMIAAMREVLPIAQKEGVNLTEADLEEDLAIIGKLSPAGMPSMRQDGLAKRPSEVELFSGTVLKKTKKYDLHAPVNQYLYDRVKEIEATY